MKLKNLMNENQEQRPLSNEVKKHFLEIVSTYNKYQEMMDRKSDLAQVAETLGGITEAARTLAIHEGDDWFDKVTIKRNMSELEKLGKEFDKVAVEANSLDQRLNGLYEDMGHILSRYYKMGEITEDQMKQRLGIKESHSNCGCGCGGVTEGGCGDKKINEAGEDVNKAMIPGDVKIKLQKALDSISGKKLTYPQKLQVLGRVIDSMGIDKGELNKVSQKLRTKLESVEKKTLKEVKDLNEEEMKLYNLGEKVEKLMEKNCPTNPSKWSYYKSQAKSKFDVYPSAYANGWASKQYKSAGGGWKKCADESVSEAKFGYTDSTASYIKKHNNEYKIAEKMNKGNEQKFYDDLQAMEDKVGHSKTMLFISNALRGYGVDMFKDPKIKNPADAQEALFLLSK